MSEIETMCPNCGSEFTARAHGVHSLHAENESLRAENTNLKVVIETINRDYAEACKPHEDLDLLRAQLAEATEIISSVSNGSICMRSLNPDGTTWGGLTEEKARAYLEKYK